MSLSGRPHTRPARRERKIAQRAPDPRDMSFHGPLQPIVRPHQEHLWLRRQRDERSWMHLPMLWSPCF
jgi:hypothetical protein